MPDVPTERRASRMPVHGHPKLSAAIFGGACASFLIGFMKAKYGLDLSGQEANLTVIIMGLTGYLAKG